MLEARNPFVRRALLSVVIAGAVIAGSVVASPDANAPGWGCPRERIGHSISDLTGRGGSASELEAASDWIPLLVEDGTIPAERLEAAFASRSGPSSYDIASGELRIDGALVARFGVSQFSDGTWVAGSVQHCMRPPVQG